MEKKVSNLLLYMNYYWQTFLRHEFEFQLKKFPS